MKKTCRNGVPVLTDWVPTPRLKRAMREVDAGRNLISLGTYEQAMGHFRRIYERARTKQKI
jgi:hypothetical protein